MEEGNCPDKAGLHRRPAWPHSWASSVQTALRTHWNYNQSSSGLFFFSQMVKSLTKQQGWSQPGQDICSHSDSYSAQRWCTCKIHIIFSEAVEEFWRNQRYEGYSLWKCSTKNQLQISAQAKVLKCRILGGGSAKQTKWIKGNLGCAFYITLYFHFHAVLLLPVLGNMGRDICLAQSQSGAVPLLSDRFHSQTWILK